MTERTGKTIIHLLCSSSKLITNKARKDVGVHHGSMDGMPLYTNTLVVMSIDQLSNSLALVVGSCAQEGQASCSDPSAGSVSHA